MELFPPLIRDLPDGSYETYQYDKEPGGAGPPTPRFGFLTQRTYTTGACSRTEYDVEYRFLYDDGGTTKLLYNPQIVARYVASDFNRDGDADLARRRVERSGSRLAGAQSVLARASPVLCAHALRLRLDAARRVLSGAFRTQVGHRRRLELAAMTLHAVSPLATLDRGYAIVTDGAHHVLHDAAGLASGDLVNARLARDAFSATVVAVTPAAADGGR